MNRAIRVFAAVTLALIVLDVLINPPRATFVTGPINLIEQIARAMLSESATLAGFATGIVTLVAIAQGRRWRWLVAFVPLAFISAYGPLFGFVFVFLFVPRLDTSDPSSSQLTIATLQLALTLVPAALTALVAFGYALRARPGVTVADLDLEVSSIKEPDPIS